MLLFILSLLGLHFRKVCLHLFIFLPELFYVFFLSGAFLFELNLICLSLFFLFFQLLKLGVKCFLGLRISLSKSIDFYLVESVGVVVRFRIENSSELDFYSSKRVALVQVIAFLFKQDG